jgi:hypothetical protein
MNIVYNIFCQWCDYVTTHDGMAHRHLRRHYRA